MNNNNTDIEKKIKIEKDIGNTEKENVKKETSTAEVKEVKKRGRKPKVEKQEELENLNDIDEQQMERKGTEEKEREGNKDKRRNLFVAFEKGIKE